MKIVYKLLILCSLLNLLDLNAQNITQTQKVAALDREANEVFGNDVAISGNFALVACNSEGSRQYPIEKSREGAVYIYERMPNGTWKEVQKLISDIRRKDDAFGSAIAISGNYAFVGVRAHDYDPSEQNPILYAGALFVFERKSNGRWVQIQKVVAPERRRSEFGAAVAVDGEYLAIGAPAYEVKDSFGGIQRVGAAYIFKKKPSGKWEFEEMLMASDKKDKTYFGEELSMDQAVLAVGAHRETDDINGEYPLKAAGAVYIYQKDKQQNWKETQKIVPSDRAAVDFFGDDLDIDGKTMAIGAYRKYVGDEIMHGAVYMYQYQKDSSWKEVQKLEASDHGKLDGFGWSVALLGDALVVTACTDYHDANGGNSLLESGSAYLFVQKDCGVWTQIQKITPNVRGYGANFGSAAAISGKDVLISAFHEKTDANQSRPINAGGAAYFFKLTGVGTKACEDQPTPDEPSKDIITDIEVKTEAGKVTLSAKQGNLTYQWGHCAGGFKPIPGATNKEFRPKTDGFYSLKFSKGEASAFSKCIPVNLPKGGIGNEEIGPTKFKVSPNPNSGKFKILIKGSMNGPYPVEIVTPLGKSIKRLSLTQRVTPIDLGQRKAAVYIIKIKTGSKTKRIPIYVE